MRPLSHVPSPIAPSVASRLSASLDHRLTRPLKADDGQTTAEYALVLLGVAAIAMLLLTWARGTGAITQLFDAVLESVIDLVP